MSGILKKIFYPNWTITEIIRGNKIIFGEQLLIPRVSQNIYKIEYSESRNKYRLNENDCSFTWRDEKYFSALQEVIKLNNQILAERKKYKENIEDDLMVQ